MTKIFSGLMFLSNKCLMDVQQDDGFYDKVSMWIE